VSQIRLQHLKTYGPNKGYERELWLAEVDGQVHRVSISHGRNFADYSFFRGDHVTEYALPSDQSSRGWQRDETGVVSPRRIAEFVADSLELEAGLDYEVGAVERQFEPSDHEGWVNSLDPMARAELQTIVDCLLKSGSTDSNGHHSWSQGSVDERLDELLQFRSAHSQDLEPADGAVRTVRTNTPPRPDLLLGP
jgi:hypothetical protein